MKLSDAFNKYSIILENGPLGTRLKYDYNFELGPHIAVRQEEGRDALYKIYCGDIDVAKENALPIIVNAPTFRASKNHLRPQGLDKSIEVRQINMACINFVKSIRDTSGYSDIPIIIGAPIGSMNDAYSVDASLDVDIAKNYHQEQINIFKDAQVDFINAVTISGLVEALGISLAAQESGLEYTIGFVLNEQGTLLDGTPLHEAIRAIDEKTTQKPLGYLITCTHASVILALTAHSEFNHLIGVQTNGSNLPSKTLATMNAPVADSPKKFSNDLNALKKQFGLKIFGGCCGTSREHLQEFAKSNKLESSSQMPLFSI
jgi:homocysteine S-methyltransferase